MGNAPRIQRANFSHRMGSELDCALDLMRRMPPSSIEDNLAGLIDLVPDLTEQLLSMVDQPLKDAHDSQARRDYLLCDYNRDGDSTARRGPTSMIPLFPTVLSPRLSSGSSRCRPTRFSTSTATCTSRVACPLYIAGISMTDSPLLYL